MKKLIKGYKLSRGAGSRKALVRSLVRGMVIDGSIKTTYTKAKMIQPIIEKLVNTAKVGDLASRRRVSAYLANSRLVTAHLYDVVTSVFSGTTGGYTRMIEMGVRRGDNAKISRLEWSKDIPPFIKKSKKTKKSTVKNTKEVKPKATKTK